MSPEQWQAACAMLTAMSVASSLGAAHAAMPAQLANMDVDVAPSEVGPAPSEIPEESVLGTEGQQTREDDPEGVGSSLTDRSPGTRTPVATLGNTPQGNAGQKRGAEGPTEEPAGSRPRSEDRESAPSHKRDSTSRPEQEEPPKAKQKVVPEEDLEPHLHCYY